MGSSFWTTFLLLSVVGAVVGLAVRLLLPRVLAWRGVWFTWHTRFGPAMVFDSADADGTTVRLLNVNGTFQSVCYVDKDLLWDPVCEYHRSWAGVVHAAWPLRRGDLAEKTDGHTEGEKTDDLVGPTGTDEPSCAGTPPKRALVMGGGGYSFPKWLVAYRPDFRCTTVEIDPKITAIAKERLFLNELLHAFNTQHTGRLNLACADAWEYLLGSAGTGTGTNEDTGSDGAGNGASTNERRFDLIVNDVFRGNRPLGKMDTREGAAHIRHHLREGGVYIGNVRTPLVGRRARTLEQARQAFAQEFAHVWVIPERPEDPRRPGNNALVACNRPLDLGTIEAMRGT